MDQHYSPKEMSKLLRVSVKTLQRWDKAKLLVAFRTPTNRRYYSHKQYLDYVGECVESGEGKTVIYGRVSNRGQQDDLNNQINFLMDFANAKGWIVDEVIEEIGSGLNYNRNKWNRLLEEVRNYKVKKIILAHKDRFIRFGYDWFEKFLKAHCVELVIVNNEKLSPEQELVQDLISIIHVFSCRIYGLRKYKKKLKEDKDVTSL